MRDWNLEKSCAEYIIGSYTMFLWGIETSKQLCPSSLMNVTQCSYEGLKPPRFDGNTAYSRLHNVPMRDWNQDNLLFFRWKFRYTMFLWGIETFIVYAPGNDIGYTMFLWGIETLRTLVYSVGLGYTMFLWGIETIRCCSRWYCFFRYTMFLWGIETTN